MVYIRRLADGVYGDMLLNELACSDFRKRGRRIAWLLETVADLGRYPGQQNGRRPDAQLFAI